MKVLEANTYSKLSFHLAGGALIRRSNGELIGVASFSDGTTDPFEVEMNGFSRLHLYYDWIREVAGLDMPVC